MNRPVIDYQNALSDVEKIAQEVIRLQYLPSQLQFPNSFSKGQPVALQTLEEEFQKKITHRGGTSESSEKVNDVENPAGNINSPIEESNHFRYQFGNGQNENFSHYNYFPLQHFFIGSENIDNIIDDKSTEVKNLDGQLNVMEKGRQEKDAEKRRRKAESQRRYIARLKERDPIGYKRRKVESQKRYLMKMKMKRQVFARSNEN